MGTLPNSSSGNLPKSGSGTLPKSGSGILPLIAVLRDILAERSALNGDAGIAQRRKESRERKEEMQLNFFFALSAAFASLR